MALTMKQMALIVSVFGVLSFILGVIAENKKPASGTPVTGEDGVTCKFPSDPTVALGSLSIVFLAASSVAGVLSLVYPYNGKAVPLGVLLKNTTFSVFFYIAVFTTGLAISLLAYPTISEQNQTSHKVHRDLNYACPTAKTGVLGGGAFLSLDSCLFWLVALMLADNAREDFLDEDKDVKGDDKVSSNAYSAVDIVI